VDDGARTLEESLRYVRLASSEGVREIVATPHVTLILQEDVTTIGPRVAALQEAIDAEGLGVQLHPGGEVNPARGPALTDEDLDVVAHGPPGARWVLLEAPFSGLDDDFALLARDFRARGFGTLIAHPERALGVLEDGGERLHAELRDGALLQVNVCSLLGQHGLEVQEAAVELLRGGLAFVLASDAHPGTRGHTLRLGFELAVAAGASSVQAWRLTQANPRLLLRQGLPSGVPVRVAA
jgi:protein-tyrosine phosphatase